MLDIIVNPIEGGKQGKKIKKRKTICKGGGKVERYPHIPKNEYSGKYFRPS